jgi:tetratricopeptide (TPR) repeat protein
MARYYLGSLFRRKGDYTSAIGPLRAASDSLRAHMGQNHRLTLMAERDLAACLSGIGEFARAESLFAETTARQIDSQGESNLAVGLTLLFRGNNYRDWDRPDEAAACYTQALDIASKLAPDSDHILKAKVLEQIAGLDTERGDWASARVRLESCLEQYRRILRPDHPNTIEAMRTLTIALERQAEPAAAVTLCREYLECARREYGPDHAETARALALLGEIEKEP